MPVNRAGELVRGGVLRELGALQIKTYSAFQGQRWHGILLLLQTFVKMKLVWCC